MEQCSNNWLAVFKYWNYLNKEGVYGVFQFVPGNKLQKQKLLLLCEQTADIVLMDTLLLTCHFLFEQKQLSL